ncbi:hypothetical protein ACFLZ4_01120 [Patescibacteria group bacterium]
MDKDDKIPTLNVEMTLFEGNGVLKEVSYEKPKNNVLNGMEAASKFDTELKKIDGLFPRKNILLVITVTIKKDKKWKQCIGQRLIDIKREVVGPTELYSPIKAEVTAILEAYDVGAEIHITGQQDIMLI